ncbi:MAG TPA: ATP-binding cassette domain-containing protein [Marisediminicola sp.]|jgi:branched-chain amino acid transport system ATP-binding protein|nr:Branched-chain amino acid transporter ATP-binding protein [Cryobacterium sp.]HEV7955844.1 ATP-binding cassette domain-containing protein [Marisediminicola sp.]
MNTSLHDDLLVPAQVVPLEQTAIFMEGIRRDFGGLTAVDIDEIRVPRGKLTALIGPNGAGKSTLFNIVTGFERPDAGTWSFEGEDISRSRAHSIAQRGMVRTFQLTRLISGQTVLENMLLAASDQHGESLWRSAWHPGWRRQERENRDRARELLSRFRLLHKADQDAATLSGGQRRLLEVARTLMAAPRAILLDEPLAGVNPALREEVMQHLIDLRDGGLTILFIEHDMDAVMGLSDHVVCLATGRRIAEGTPEEVAGNERVIDAYLGARVEEKGDAPRGPHISARFQAREPVDVDRTADSPGQVDVPVLSVQSLVAGYHPDRPILTQVDAMVSRGEVVAVIGANGAGKSTLLKAVAGLVEVQSGAILVEGRSVLGSAVHERTRHGIGFVPQSQNVFPSLSVIENLRMGAFGMGKERDDAIARVLDLLPDLKDRLAVQAGSLSGGQRQAVAMARALVPQPSLMLLDEPSAGLSPLAQAAAFAHIAQVAESGVSILIVEQNARDCLAISHRGYVLEQGAVALTGTGTALLHDDRVIELYLGAMNAKRRN